MEDLTKTQIVLVTLLLTFVTSIATGIVTVSLVNKAPPNFIQTVNRVVERTIEKVVPATVTGSNQASVITKETIVIKEDDLIVSSIEKNSKSLVRIIGYETEGDEKSFRAVGMFVNANGLIATDGSVVANDGVYEAVQSDGTLLPLVFKQRNQTGDIAFFEIKMAKESKDPKDPKEVKLSYMPITLGLKGVSLGQSVISISGADKNSVSVGIVSSLNEEAKQKSTTSEATTTADTDKTDKPIVSLKTSIDSTGLVAGSPLLNLSGDVVGIKVRYPQSGDKNIFVPSSVINSAIAAIANATTSVKTK